MYRKSDLFTMFVLVLVIEHTGGAALGEDCTATDCTTANAVCPATGDKICACDTGYTQQDTACKAVLGSTCTATADCTSTVANSDCTGTGTKTCTCATGYTQQGAACKAVLGSTCTATADCNSTVANSDCTGTGTKTCTCATGYTQQGAACKAVLGSTCTATADCTSTVANSDCTGTGTKTCTCATGYTQQGAACKADLGTACTTTPDCHTATTATAVCDVLATTKVCKIGSAGDCTDKIDKCVSNAACTSNLCVCSTKYKENTDKLCATVLGSTCTVTADCNSAVANSDCTGTGSKTCTCNTGFTKQGADCSGATAVAACLAMILACIFTTIV